MREIITCLENERAHVTVSVPVDDDTEFTEIDESGFEAQMKALGFLVEAIKEIMGNLQAEHQATADLYRELCEAILEKRLPVRERPNFISQTK